MDLVAAAKSSCGLSNFRGSAPLPAATWTLPTLTWSSFRSSAIFLREFVHPVARRQACECDRPFGRDRNLQIWGQRQTEVANIAIEGVSEN